MTQPASGVQLLLSRLGQFSSLDPQAVLAVARQEGLGGGIGDNGTSFGPFQLHYGGGYPSFAPQGATASQQWAWSPAGIDYALGRISQVAGGLHGPSAVNAIVNRFERPANPSAEVAGALHSYGAPAPSGAGFSPPPPVPAAPAPMPGMSTGMPAAVQLALRILAA